MLDIKCSREILNGKPLSCFITTPMMLMQEREEANKELRIQLKVIPSMQRQVFFISMLFFISMIRNLDAAQ
jgi:hypothetical protein